LNTFIYTVIKPHGKRGTQCGSGRSQSGNDKTLTDGG
jgi:hypothetical protein